MGSLGPGMMDNPRCHLMADRSSVPDFRLRVLGFSRMARWALGIVSDCTAVAKINFKRLDHKLCMRPKQLSRSPQDFSAIAAPCYLTSVSNQASF